MVFRHPAIKNKLIIIASFEDDTREAVIFLVGSLLGNGGGGCGAVVIVTRWLDYFSIYVHLQQLKFDQLLNIFAIMTKKFAKEGSTFCHFYKRF